MKKNILIFDEEGFAYGSTQKLLRQMAKILARDFNIFFAFGQEEDQQEKLILEQAGVRVVPFTFKYKQSREPFGLKGMRPGIWELIAKYNIHCVYLAVFAHYQFPINHIPAGIPLVLISPFGHYFSNGNVYKVYVSGQDNRRRIMSRGVSNVEVFFNPLTDYSPEILNKPSVSDQVVFGRLGRGDDNIFDPIAVKAFKKLEDIYGNKVKYVVVNPPPAWQKLAEELGVRNMESRPAITEFGKLSEFYHEIDVFAHARKDGETVGIAIGEAMMAGNPILTHKSHFHNDHFDILDQSFALWCEADDAESYFQNMKWMVEHKDQIRLMGQLARKRALKIFSLENQTSKIIADFQEACQKYYNNTFWGKLKGYSLLYWENVKALPFFLGKFLTYKFPSLYKSLRKFYYE